MTGLPALGWREWVALPDLEVPWIKAKVDTGARSSSIHASDIEVVDRDDVPWVRFVVEPWQRAGSSGRPVEAPLLEHRSVRSSSGAAEERPVIRTSIRLGSTVVEADLTLAERDSMGFRMLIGREAIRRHFVVDPGRSYLQAKPPRSAVAQNRGRVLPPGRTL